MKKSFLMKVTAATMALLLVVQPVFVPVKSRAFDLVSLIGAGIEVLGGIVGGNFADNISSILGSSKELAQLAVIVETTASQLDELKTSSKIDKEQYEKLKKTFDDYVKTVDKYMEGMRTAKYTYYSAQQVVLFYKSVDSYWKNAKAYGYDSLDETIRTTTKGFRYVDQALKDCIAIGNLVKGYTEDGDVVPKDKDGNKQFSEAAAGSRIKALYLNLCRARETWEGEAKKTAAGDTASQYEGMVMASFMEAQEKSRSQFFVNPNLSLDGIMRDPSRLYTYDWKK